VSGSGFFCYALAWGINNKLLDKATYLPVVEKCWIALNTCVNEEGRVGWVQPIGADPRRNFSEDSWEVYGTGAFLLAGSEVIKLKR
jgi:rhamnogalacturonyl hydrolase YesR